MRYQYYAVHLRFDNSQSGPLKRMKRWTDGNTWHNLHRSCAKCLRSRGTIIIVNITSRNTYYGDPSPGFGIEHWMAWRMVGCLAGWSENLPQHLILITIVGVFVHSCRGVATLLCASTDDCVDDKRRHDDLLLYTLGVVQQRGYVPHDDMTGWSTKQPTNQSLRQSDR